MKVFIFVSLMILFCGSTVVADTDLEEQVRANQQRIERLEEKIGILQENLEYLQSQPNSSTSGGNPVDPLIGKWNCSNSLYNYDIDFDSTGHVVQEGVVLGSAKSTTWSRVGDSQIVFADGSRLRPDFQSRDEFTVQVVNSGTLWECKRISQ